MFSPKKSLGQNFLNDKNIIKKIIKITDIKNENIVEVGPGTGNLTNEIIKSKPKKLILIEKDFNLYKFLLNKYSNYKFVNILNEDILNFNFHNLNKYKLISNLPYNISSKFLMKSIILNKNIKQIVCMIQSELADKFNISFGKMNKYKFACKYCCNYEILFTVSSNVFYPKPKVKSKVVVFNLKNKNINSIIFNFFIKNFFVNKRKKIKSNKFFDDKIFQEYLNCRYEDLNYNDILKIYKRFELSIS